MERLADTSSLEKSTAEVVNSDPAKPRLYFVDHLRVFLTILVIAHHLAVTYGVVGPWYYMEPPNNELITILFLVFVLLNQAYFMGLFFLISGYFTPGSYERKGARAFLWDRVVRLGVPILLFVFVLGPLSMIPAFGYTNSIAAPGETMTYWQFYPLALGPGPLWFLEALLLWSLLYVLWRWLTRGQAATNPVANPVSNQPVDAQGPNHARYAPSTPSTMQIVVFTLLLALVTFVWRIWVPIGLSVPIIAFPSASHIPQYISLFAIGALAYRRNWLMNIPDRAGRISFAAAGVATLGLFAVAIVDITGFFTNFAGGISVTSATYALWEAIFCVGMTIGLLTSFRHHFNRQNALGKFLSEQAYAVYIFHAPVIVAVAYAMQGWQLHPLLKFVVACAIGIPLCFMVAYGVRKIPLANRVF